MKRVVTFLCFLFLASNVYADRTYEKTEDGKIKVTESSILILEKQEIISKLNDSVSKLETIKDGYNARVASVDQEIKTIYQEIEEVNSIVFPEISEEIIE